MVIMIYYFKSGAITVCLDQQNYNSAVPGYFANKTPDKLKHLRCLAHECEWNTLENEKSLFYNTNPEWPANNITFNL